MNTLQNPKVDWIAADWGTSNLRVWLMGPDNEPVQDLKSDAGMGSLTPEEFEPVLVSLVKEHLAPGTVTPVIACGMVGAKQGWIEARYATVPCKAPGMAESVRAPASDPLLDVRILPGVCQHSPADVMRGEETQIRGFLAQNPSFDGVLCLPGTHSKWVRISAEEIVSFQTFMTGELFALLADQSVLRHSVISDDQDDAAFASAVQDAMSNPERVAARLFGLRAGSLVGDLDSATARSTLSGMLIGLELAGARPYWLGMDIAIIGETALARLYQTALKDQGIDPRMTNASEMTLAGLTAAYQELEVSK